MTPGCQKYLEQVRVWMEARAAAGGTLTEDQESEYTEACDVIWQGLSWEERDVVEATHRKGKVSGSGSEHLNPERADAAGPANSVGTPWPALKEIVAQRDALELLRDAALAELERRTAWSNRQMAELRAENDRLREALSMLMRQKLEQFKQTKQRGQTIDTLCRALNQQGRERRALKVALETQLRNDGAGTSEFARSQPSDACEIVQLRTALELEEQEAERLRGVIVDLEGPGNA